MIVKRLQLFLFLLITKIAFAKEYFPDIKVDEKYLQVEDYVTQSPKYGAFARLPGPYDENRKKAEKYLAPLKSYYENYQPLIDEGKAAGYSGKGHHLANASYVLDNYEDFRTTFKHLVDNCINDNYTVPIEFRFDTVGFRNDKSVYKIQCFEHYELYRLSVFPNMGLCYSINMTEIFKGISYHLGTVYDRAECKVGLDNDKVDGKGEILYFRSEKLGELIEGPVPKTLVDFIMQSEKWKTKLNIVDKSGAYDYIENMATGKRLYETIKAEYTYWYREERLRSIEVDERNTTFKPTLTGKKMDGESGFIALTSESAAGFLSEQMEWALKSGNITVGYFKTIKPLVQWNYTIIAIIDGSADGESPTNFMKNIAKPGKEGKITDEYVMASIVTGIAYRKKGTCNVKLVASDTIFKGRPEDSPQFNNKEGVDMMPVHYRDEFVQAGACVDKNC